MADVIGKVTGKLYWLENDGKGKFSPLDAAALRHKTLSHDAVLEDLDHDGLIDIYVGVDAESGNKWATSKGGNVPAAGARFVELWIHEQRYTHGSLNDHQVRQ